MLRVMQKTVLKQIFTFSLGNFSLCKIDAEARQEISKTVNFFFSVYYKTPLRPNVVILYFCALRSASIPILKAISKSRT